MVDVNVKLHSMSAMLTLMWWGYGWRLRKMEGG